MVKVLIIYVSMLGNIEDIVIIIKEMFQEYELDIDCIEIDDVDVFVLIFYDYVLIGIYIWGDGDLFYEVEDFFEEVKWFQFNGLKIVCFGFGDYFYLKFCEVVNLFSVML